MPILSKRVVYHIGFFLGYLHNSVFPPLLTEEEEAANLRALAAGSEEAKRILIIHNLRLVAHICKKFETSGIDRDDLISIGIIGLIKGVNTFSLDRKTRLATYAARCIENEILMHLRSIRNQKTEISLYDPVGVDKEGNEVTLIDILGSREMSAEEKVELDEERQLLRDHLYVLDDKES
ncbi:MAG: sigma-70 family RNA polymerase sigma factor, partial [Firmicutes bacterium]|nr:sigma-70 family RNA polymerase sigma factor [Bacillota bacterium]